MPICLDPTLIALLAVIASLLSPFLTEWLKKKFGREEQAQKQRHDAHSELIAEMTLLRSAKALAEASEAQWQEKYQVLAEGRISLLKDLAAKEVLIDSLTGLIKDLTAELKREKETRT